MAEDETLTAKEVADHLKLTERILHRLTQEGSCRGFKVGNSWRLRRGTSMRGGGGGEEADGPTPAVAPRFRLGEESRARGEGHGPSRAFSGRSSRGTR